MVYRGWPRLKIMLLPNNVPIRIKIILGNSTARFNHDSSAVKLGSSWLSLVERVHVTDLILGLMFATLQKQRGSQRSRETTHLLEGAWQSFYKNILSIHWAKINYVKVATQLGAWRSSDNLNITPVILEGF